MSIVKRYHHGNLREALIEAAADLARAEGSDGVVLREVARRTGVSHNAAYRHFDDREALLAEIASVGMDRLEQAMRQQMDAVRARSPQDRATRRLRAAGRAYVTFALSEPGFFEVAFSTKPLPDELAPEGVDGVRPEVGDDQPPEGPYALLGSALDDLVAVGELEPKRRTGADVTCWAAVHGFAELNLHGPLRALADDAREPLLEGLLDTVERGLTLRMARRSKTPR
jgi:AcrR family transcriptional regulator